MTRQHASRRSSARRGALTAAALLGASVSLLTFAHNVLGASASNPNRPAKSFQTQEALTPLQRQVERERAKLFSSDVEERREAVTRLGALGRPEASRAVVPALGDRSAVVRATAARAVVSLGPSDVAALLAPLLARERDEFVRREAAYALGLARSRAAVPALVTALESDKQPSVRGAAAVALGQIGDPSAVGPLTRKLSERIPGTGLLARVTRRKKEEDEFVRRSAAVALGLIGSREAVPALTDSLSNEKAGDDVRRESAIALGLIGDPSAAPALRAVLNTRDPHLSRAAFDALRKLEAPPPT